MRIADVGEMRALSRKMRRAGHSIGLVPTMGFLHEGHLSLVRCSVEECDRTVVSVFVNPTQFGPGEDLENYPRDLDRDAALVEEMGADVLYHPKPEDMYPPGFDTWVVPGAASKPLCGQSRPTHFRGVTTVVTKLFHRVNPDVAWFGQKDYQQARVLQRMVLDLDFDVTLRILPTVREEDGLALSTRNAYLSEDERRQAPIIHRALLAVESAFGNGERKHESLVRIGREVLAGAPSLREDYLEVRDDETLEDGDPGNGALGDGAVVAAAAWLGETRLIDNLLLGTAATRLG